MSKRKRKPRKILPLAAPRQVLDLMEPDTKAYSLGNCTIFVSHSEEGWHLSISHELRYPTWDEIKQARYELCPDDVTMAMILSPSNEYVNVHSRCFHLWEIPGVEVGP